MWLKNATEVYHAEGWLDTKSDKANPVSGSLTIGKGEGINPVGYVITFGCFLTVF